MIDKIETVIMDLSGLKTVDEIKSYIPTQLIKYHPKPDMLIFDYVITGKADNKKGLVSYTLKHLVDGCRQDDLLHPLLLFKSLIKRDGTYLIGYNSTMLELEIISGVIQSCCQSKLDLDYIKSNVKSNPRVICDNSIYLQLRDIYPKIESLENLYKKCKKDLFIDKKRTLLKPLLLIATPIFFLTLLFFNIKSQYDNTMAKLKSLENEYVEVQSITNNTTDYEDKYNKLLEELYIIRSQNCVDLYNVFYDLNSYGKSYKIVDFNYSNRFLTVNAISRNSISLIKNLNKSTLFNFTQNSTTTNMDIEQVNFSGEIKCP